MTHRWAPAQITVTPVVESCIRQLTSHPCVSFWTSIDRDIKRSLTRRRLRKERRGKCRPSAVFLRIGFCRLRGTNVKHYDHIRL